MHVSLLGVFAFVSVIDRLLISPTHCLLSISILAILPPPQLLRLLSLFLQLWLCHWWLSFGWVGGRVGSFSADSVYALSFLFSSMCFVWYCHEALLFVLYVDVFYCELKPIQSHKEVLIFYPVCAMDIGGKQSPANKLISTSSAQMCSWVVFISENWTLVIQTLNECGLNSANFSAHLIAFLHRNIALWWLKTIVFIIADSVQQLIEQRKRQRCGKDF